MSGLPAEVQKPVYTLKVVEVSPEQDLEQAILKNAPVLEGRYLTGDSVQFAEKDGRLVAGKIYAWRVTASDQKGTEIGRSGASFFAIGSWPPWNFCFLIPAAQAINYCIGQTVVVGYAFYVPSGGPYSWTLSPGGGMGVSTSATITIPAGLITSPGPHNYTLTVSGPGCSRSVPITIVASPQATAGQAWVSGAIHYWDTPTWTTSEHVCCGTAWKLKLDPPIAGNVQWQQNTGSGWTNVPGATGANANVNPDPTLCNATQPVTVQYRAVVSTTNPPCSDYISNVVTVTIYPPAQPGSVVVLPPAICNDGTSKSQVYLFGAVGTVSWFKDLTCSGTWTPFTPSGIPFTVGPLTQNACYKAVVQSGPTGPYACPAVQSVATVVVDQKPVAGTITAAPATICPGDDSVLTLTGQTGNVQWYSSTNPNPATFFNTANQISGATNNTTQDTNILNTTTYFGVQVSSPNGVCSAVSSAIVPVTVNQPPSPPVITGPNFICLNGSATLTAPPLPPGSTYQWYCNGEPCGTNSTTMTVTEPGNYWVDISWSALNKICGTVSSNIITIQPDLLAVAIKGPCCPCKGQKAQLCAVVSNGKPPYTYSWNNGAPPTACITFTANATTTYTVTVTDANGCKASKSFTITVCP